MTVVYFKSSGRTLETQPEFLGEYTSLKEAASVHNGFSSQIRSAGYSERMRMENDRSSQVYYQRGTKEMKNSQFLRIFIRRRIKDDEEEWVLACRNKMDILDQIRGMWNSILTVRFNLDSCRSPVIILQRMGGWSDPTPETEKRESSSILIPAYDWRSAQ